MEQSQSYMVAGGNSQDGSGLCLLSLGAGRWPVLTTKPAMVVLR